LTKILCLAHAMTWNINERQATIPWNCGTAVVDLHDWRGGLTFADGMWQGCRFTGLPEIQPADLQTEREAYVRGDDLILTRGSSAADPFRYQLYYRPWFDLPVGVEAAVEVMFSVQTPLWETEPEINVVTTISNAAFATQFSHEVEVATTDGVMLQMTHPLDFIESQVHWRRSPDMQQAGLEVDPIPGLGDVEVRQRLFARRLEKGVILRARLWFGWAQIDNELFDWEACRERFYQSAPILTV
jgi:hypothetical protein